MIEFIIFLCLLVAGIGVTLWQDAKRRKDYDEWRDSIRRSLETIADCCVDVSVAIDSLDLEGEQK